MTELSFLVDLLLNHKLPKATRDAVAARIKEVEERYASAPVQVALSAPRPLPPHIAKQAPSTIAAMIRHGEIPIADAGNTITVSTTAELPPVAIVAQTPAAVAAMNSRSQAIAESMAGKVDKNTGRPRKF